MSTIAVIDVFLQLTVVTRALQSAREQLIKVGGDTSQVDSAIQLAAKRQIADPETPKYSDGPEVRNTLAYDNAKITRSLLARGSAADLESLQNGNLLPRTRDLGEESSSKRRRTEGSREVGSRHQCASTSQNLERLPSRELMPPPSVLPARPMRVATANISNNAKSNESLSSTNFGILTDVSLSDRAMQEVSPTSREDLLQID